MSNKQILIDGMYCAYRSLYAFKDLKTSNGVSSGLLFGFIITLKSIIQRWPDANVIVCWDSQSTWRREIYAGYKQNRTSSKTEDDKKQLYAVADFCRSVCITQAVAQGYEADDVIGSLIDPTLQNIIYSRDRDFCQLVCDHVILYSPKSGMAEEIIFDRQKVIDKYGVSPEKMLLYRSLRGDTSDNLPGLSRFPSKKIIEIVDKIENVDQIKDILSGDISFTDRQQQVLADFYDQFVNNFKIMKIQTNVEVHKFTSDFQRDKALKILDDFELKSLKSSLSVFEHRDDEEDLMCFFN